jgi:hypothetical protein
MDVGTQALHVGTEGPVTLLELGELRDEALTLAVTLLDATSQCSEVAPAPSATFDRDRSSTLPVGTRVGVLVARPFRTA